MSNPDYAAELSAWLDSIDRARCRSKADYAEELLGFYTWHCQHRNEILPDLRIARIVRESAELPKSAKDSS